MLPSPHSARSPAGSPSGPWIEPRLRSGFLNGLLYSLFREKWERHGWKCWIVLRLLSLAYIGALLNISWGLKKHDGAHHPSTFDEPVFALPRALVLYLTAGCNALVDVICYFNFYGTPLTLARLRSPSLAFARLCSPLLAFAHLLSPSCAFSRRRVPSLAIRHALAARAAQDRAAARVRARAPT